MEKINSVLVIDDDEITNTLTFQILKRLNFSKEITLMSNAEEALRLLEQNQNSPELIMIDITMPGMDGFEFIEEFNKRSFNNQNKIIKVILTSSSDLNHIRKAKKMGVNDYLIKPLTRNAVVQVLQSHNILL